MTKKSLAALATEINTNFADNTTRSITAAKEREVATDIKDSFVHLDAVWNIRVLDCSAVAASVTGTTAETALATISIAAGVMGLHGRLRVTTLWSYTNSANNKTLRARFNGIAGTAYFSQANTTTATQRAQTEIQNRNSASSQVGNVASAGAQWTASSVAIVTSAVDTSAAVDLVISGQLANSSETITLESYLVELIVPN